MGKLFNLENPFWVFIGKVTNSVLLNIIWLIFSLPIFTIGASTTALYYVNMKVIDEREGSSLLKEFWKSFKLNFKQATVIWLICLVLGGFFAGDIWFYYIQEKTVSSVIAIVFMVLLLLLLMTMTYVFPVLSKFDNSIKKTITYALVLSVRYIYYTIPILLIPVVFALGAYMWPPLLLFGFGTVSFFQSYLFRQIFKRFLPKENEEETGTEEEVHIVLDGVNDHVVIGEKTTDETEK